METDAPLAPPVVAVVVVHAPGDWFDETLSSLAAQDYPNLDTLFLLTAASGADARELETRIVAQLPDAYVRPLETNPGFGTVANEVLRLVEGDSGFFCFCHDDIALDSDAVRMLVEEVYRSNAGLVGPKLVQWDEPGVLQRMALPGAVVLSFIQRRSGFGSRAPAAPRVVRRGRHHGVAQPVR